MGNETHKLTHTIKVTHLPVTLLRKSEWYKVESLLIKNPSPQFRLKVNTGLNIRTPWSEKAGLQKTALIMLLGRMGYVVEHTTTTDDGWLFHVRAIDERGWHTWIHLTKEHRDYYANLQFQEVEYVHKTTREQASSWEVDPEA
jgi:hypothetical protein